MVIVRIQGGLGNQMFQYALGLQLESLGRTVHYDYASYGRDQDSARRFELPLFGIECVQASEAELRRFGQGRSLISRIGKRFGMFRQSNIDAEEIRVSGGAFFSASDQAADRLRQIGGRYEEDLVAGFQPLIFGMDDVYLSGYWQCERYFAEIREQLLQTYRFPDLTDGSTVELRERMDHSSAVSVHIRRGDYLTLQHVYGGICTQEYYRKAMSLIKEHIEDPTFYLFSDDPEWVRQNCSGPDIVVVDEREPDAAWMDMYLMTRCRANIIANSSFSWWGAWLNQTDGRIVISPEKWFANHEVHDAVCADWITIAA